MDHNELYTFHEAVNQLQDAEEQLVECHKKSVKVRKRNSSFGLHVNLQSFNQFKWTIGKLLKN